MAVRASFPLGFALLLLTLFMLSPLVVCKPTEKFLKHLEGCHKGQNIKGVSQVKQYLKNFGYLHYGDHANHSKDDEYDDLLESAVKTYQLNYHLNQSGILDVETLNEMIKPRCGVADIINGATRMQSGKKKKKPTSLRTVSHFRFFQGNPPPTWNKYELTYRFRSTVEVVDVQTLRSVISKAFSKWEAVTQFTFKEAQDGSSSDIEIGFHKLSHDDNAPFDGLGGTLAHAYPPTNGRFHYDADENWSTDPSATSHDFDLESVAVHEIGHLLGLHHSEFREAIMWSGIAPGTIKRELATDDIQGIRTLYGLTS